MSESEDEPMETVKPCVDDDLEQESPKEPNEYSSEEYKQFIMELIAAYKEHSILWDKKHPDYRKNALKEKPLQKMYKKYVEYYPDHCMELMKDKLENLRTCFIRQYKKVQSAKKRNTYYRPNLFYYDQLHFICGGEQFKEQESIESCMEQDRETENECSEEYKKFITDLIAAYKEHPILWDKKHPDYRKHTLKEQPLQEVYKKYLEYCPDQSLQHMKEKLENLRTCFRRHYKRVQETKKINTYYRPNLFYYDQLYFIASGDEEHEEPENTNSPEYRQFILEFIDCLKQYPILWDKDHPEFWCRVSEKQPAYEQLFRKFIEYYPESTIEMMKGKIDNLKGIVQKQHQKVLSAKKKNLEYKPTTFYYDAMSFINQEPEYLNTVEEYRKFLTEFLGVFKKLNVLWDKTHPHYTKPSEKVDAFNEMFIKYLEYYPGSNIDSMKEKLENVRTVFRREWHKVQAAKKENKDYKPRIFYYNLLLFTVGEGNSTWEQQPESKSNIKDFEEPLERCHYYWSREHTAVLINLMKKYPDTYTRSVDKDKKMRSFNALTMDLMAECEKKFRTEEVVKKVENLKTVYRRYHLKGRKPELSAWMFEQMKEFMPNPSSKTEKREKKINLRARKKEPKYKEQDSESDLDVTKFKEESKYKEPDSADSDFSGQYYESTNDLSIEPEIEYSPPSKVKEEDEKLDPELAQLRTTIATKLRDMPDDQRQYAEHLISEVMYAGLMEELTEESNIQF